MNAVELPLWPGFDNEPVTHEIEQVALGARTVDVAWDDGRTSRYHFRWLRDMCPCNECLNPITREQLLDISTVPESIAAVSADIDAAGALVIAWSDNQHSSRYHPGWLRHHDYSNRAAAAVASTEITTWGREFAEHIPTFDGGAVLGSDEALHAWLIALRRYGLARLRDVTTESSAIERVAARIGVIRESNFGRVFDVRSQPDPVSNAYTPVGLLPHTDLPTRETQPGIQMLHCLQNTARGGESVMVDGFRLAETLREEQPAAFEVLTRIPIDYTNRAQDSDYRWRAPMIALDDAGAVTELRPGVSLRAPVDAPFDEMDALYDGIQAFVRYTCDARLRAVFPIRPGDLLAMDNRRVLHARNSYETSSGERHLRGCYLDRDELLSRIRVLERHR